LFISDDGSVVVDDDVDVVGVLAALWILNPKINEDIPIKKETTARIFPVIPGTITNAVLSLFVVVAVLLRYL
jgi:hypothetical protein